MEHCAGYADDIVNMWKTAQSADFGYYAKYDTDEMTEPFWRHDRPFYPSFLRLDTTRTLEIACGTGRHAARIADRAEELYLIDTSVDALEIARKRFAAEPHVKVLMSRDGETIPLADNSFTAVFSYDAMVHFEATTVLGYLRETARVLSGGGRALFHHSLYDRNPSGSFRDNPQWRNYMNESLFAYFASRAGLRILQTLHFNESAGVGMIDGLTLMEKPK